MADEKRVYIRELARMVNRRETTVRGWCRTNRLPRRLRPQRVGNSGWRYWTEYQADAIKKWMDEEGLGPGRGLKNFDPTPEQADGLLEKLRTKRVD